MELDDLKIAWNALDQRLAAQNRLQFELLKDKKMGQIRSTLRPALIGNVIQLTVGILMMSLFAPFWVEHIKTPHLLIAGLLLHAYGLMFVIYAGRELHLIATLDYGGPVLAIQKQVDNLQNWRQRIAPHFGVVGSVIWIPLLMVIFKWLGVDIWSDKPQVVFWFVVSALVSLVVLFAVMKWEKRSGENGVGWNIRRAATILDDLARFEQE